MGILQALVNRGLAVQPFKVGPDYIDPMFQTAVAGRASRNLDSWLLERDVLLYLFSRNTTGADMAVIEGVMGLYDGCGGKSLAGSTAEVAEITVSPVILVVNGEGIALSIVALLKGYLEFDRNLTFGGVIINKVKSESHYRLLKSLVEEHLNLPVAGYLPPDENYTLNSRHLGLVPSGEVAGLKEKLARLAGQMEKTIDLDLILKIAAGASNLPPFIFNLKPPPTLNRVKIAVAQDQAFNFYYADNLDLLEDLGAELVFFSPLNDRQVPEGVAGLYLGGGYPEVFGAELEKNRAMPQSIRGKIDGGLPVYAECGGLIYLSRNITDRGGSKFRMTGIIPEDCKMTGSLQRFGYVEIEVVRDNVLARKGSRIRGHEFHYSRLEAVPDLPACFEVRKSTAPKPASTWSCGFQYRNLLAGYPHLHFWSNPEFAREFVKHCVEFAENKK